MQNDIDMDSSLRANEGQTYTINGNGHTISDVYLSGEGTVKINADVTGEDNFAALYVSGSANVTVNGDVTGQNGDPDDVDYDNGWDYSDGADAVNAYGDATVTINGDVTGGDAYGTYSFAGEGVEAYDNANVTVNGDVTGGSVTADPETQGEISEGGEGVYAQGKATVTVTGDVTGGSTNGYHGEGGYGVYAYEQSTIAVGGSVTGGDGGTNGYGGDGVRAEDQSTVTVGGSATGGSGSLTDEQMQDPLAYSDGGDGVDARDNAKVTIGGSATGGNGVGTYGYSGNGVYAKNQSQVTVTGSATGGNVTADPDVQVNSSEYSIAGSGIFADSTTVVSVGGDAIGGSTQADGGHAGRGIYILSDDYDDEEPVLGSITVYGTAKGGSAPNGVDAEALYFYSYGRVAYLVSKDPERMSDLNIDFLEYYCESLDLTDEELSAYWTELFGDKDPDDATQLEQIEFMQHVVVSELGKMTVEEYAQFYFPTVTVWALSDENGGMVGSRLGEPFAINYNALTTNYIIKTIQPKNGTLTADKETALEGETVTVTVTSDDGYEVKGVYCGTTVLTANTDGTYTYVVPMGGAVEFSAVIEPVPVEDADPPADGEKVPTVTPSTGDGFELVLVTMLAVVSVLGFGLVVSQRKKFVK